MTANASENSNRESEVGRLAHYCVRRGVPNLEWGRNIIQKYGPISFKAHVLVLFMNESTHMVKEGIQKKIDFFLGKSPKLWVGGGQES